MPASQVFISYSHRDTTFAHMVERVLRTDGISVWVDRQQLVGGSAWRAELQQAIADCQVCVLVMSPHALASEEVRKEYMLALSLGKPVVPLTRGAVRAAPDELRALQWHDCAGLRVTRGIYDLLYTLESLGIPISAPPNALSVDEALVRVIHGQVPATWHVFHVNPLRYRRRRSLAFWAGFAALTLFGAGSVLIIFGAAPAGTLVVLLALLLWMSVAVAPVSFCAIVWAYFTRLLSLRDVPEFAIVTEHGFAFVETRFWGTVPLRVWGYNFAAIKRLDTRPTWRRRARLTIWPITGAAPITLAISPKFGDTYEIARRVMNMYSRFHLQRGTLEAATGMAPMAPIEPAIARDPPSAGRK